MKVRLQFVVLLLGAVAGEQLRNISSDQNKSLEIHVKLSSRELSQRIPSGNASQRDPIVMSIFNSELTSNNNKFWRHERGPLKSNNKELEKNHDSGFEYKAHLYESYGPKEVMLLDYKNVRRKKRSLNEFEKEPVKYQGLEKQVNVQDLPSTSEGFHEISITHNEVTENSLVDGLNKGQSEKHRPDLLSVTHHQKNEDVTSEEVEAQSVNGRVTSASPQKDEFNDSLSTLSLTKTDAETCRFSMHPEPELPLINSIYERITCFMCYVFIPKHRKKLELQLEYSSYTFSYENLTKEPFDPSSSVSWAIVRQSFIDDLEASKLEDCCAEATDCCLTISQATGTQDTEGDFCPATWDGWSCFSVPVPAGTTVPVKCPVYAYTGYPECYLHGQKTCMPDGTWFKKGNHEYTDYSLCSMESYHSFVNIWELAVHSASILVLLPALVVLLCYRSLQKPWFHMLLNFYVALLLRSVMMIIELSVIKIPENKHISTIMEENGVGCKIVVSLRMMSLLSVWVWMLANSVFLYRSVARALSRTTNIKIYYFTAWGGAVLLTAVWVTCRALLEDYQCWLGDVKGDPYKLTLIIDIPIVLSLLISLGLLSHLACLVFSNMRGRSESITEDNKRAFRATVFLVPMFGLQFFLSAVVFRGVDCTQLKVNLCFATALTGLQGLYASIVYCFMNAEVKRELLKTWNSLAARLCTRGSEALYPQSSVGPQTTYSTVHTDTQADPNPAEMTELVALNSNR